MPRARITADPMGLGQFHQWAFSWPANRRVMYNRASADAAGKPWDPKRVGIQWNGEKWVGDVPDIKPDSPPGKFGAFIMLPEGVGRLFAPALNDGPFPEHYEAVEAPVDNVLHPKVAASPVAQAVQERQGQVGEGGRVPHRLHHLPPHRALPLLDQAPAALNEVQPGIFFEIPEELAKEKGIADGEKVRSPRPAGPSRERRW